jgi:transducin (beta)-like 1
LPGFFGPLAPPLSPPPGADGDEYENVRKREADPRQSQIRNGSPAKRIKLSNGHENGIDMMPMDINEIPNGNGHAYPSPKEVEQPPTPIIATDGPEKSTQVEKVAELGSETTYLTLSDPDNPESKPLVLFCAWNPRDPTILAGAGTDKLARLWTISRGTAPEAHGHVNSSRTPYQDLVDRNSTARSPDVNPTITALSWTSDGAAIALAYEAEDEYSPSERDSAKVAIWGADGSLIDEYPGFEPPILCLQWNPSSTALLALVPDGNSTMIIIFCLKTQRTASQPLPEHNQDMPPLDASWTGDQEFLVCGGDLLVTFTWSDSTINRMRKFETREDHQLAKATYDRHSRLLATASETGIIDVSYSLFFQSSVIGSITNGCQDMGELRPMSFEKCASRADHLITLATYPESHRL